MVFISIVFLVFVWSLLLSFGSVGPFMVCGVWPVLAGRLFALPSAKKCSALVCLTQERLEMMALPCWWNATCPQQVVSSLLMLAPARLVLSRIFWSNSFANVSDGPGALEADGTWCIVHNRHNFCLFPLEMRPHEEYSCIVHHYRRTPWPYPWNHLKPLTQSTKLATASVFGHNLGLWKLLNMQSGSAMRKTNCIYMPWSEGF